MTLLNPAATIGHNAPTPYELIKQEIEDLFDEAKNFADGEPIESEEMHDAIKKLHDGLHDAGNRADAARIEENKPFDDGKAAVQAKYAPLIANTKSVKGKVVLGKESLSVLLSAWRKRVADEKAAIAEAKRVEAARIAAEAQAAMQASRGNLEARVAAEELVAHAKDVAKDARRSEKAAENTGLRTFWKSEIADIEAALDYFYPRYTSSFVQLVEELAHTEVSTGARELPGIRIWGEQVATVGRV